MVKGAKRIWRTTHIADAEHRMKTLSRRCNATCRAIRTGRATPALVERLMVEYYGTPTPLLQIAAHPRHRCAHADDSAVG